MSDQEAFLCDSCLRKERYGSRIGNTAQGFKCGASGKTLKFLSLIKECENHRPIDFINYGDLFRGIGGFRLGIEKANSEVGSHSEQGLRSEERRGEPLSQRRGRRNIKKFRCVWSCDNNRFVNQVYFSHFRAGNHDVSKDIREVDAGEIPDLNLLCAGFPCQTFSIAGKRQGIQGPTGTLFYEILRVARAKRPRLLLLENVAGLLSNEKGKTFAEILHSLDELGYWVEWQVLNSQYFGVPQSRPRVFIIGHLRGQPRRPVFPITQAERIPTGESTVAPKEREACTLGANYWKAENLSNMVISPRVAKALTGGGHSGGLHSQMTVLIDHPNAHTTKRIRGIDSDAYGLGGSKTGILQLSSTPKRQVDRYYSPQGILPALNANSGGQLTPRIFMNGYRIRRLTPVECERLQGFPDNWTYGVSDTQRYRLLGNAVTVPVVEFLGRRIIDQENHAIA